MTKVGNDNKEWQNAVKLGERNKELIPQIRNWCSHIILEDVSGGMIAAVHNLPISLKISCPHSTNGSQAMNLEWIASDFIKDSCQACRHHKEIFKPNFGTEVLERHYKQKEKRRKLEFEEKEKKHAFKKQIDSLFQKQADSSKVTELSILKLIQSLEESKVKKKNATKIL